MKKFYFFKFLNFFVTVFILLNVKISFAQNIGISDDASFTTPQSPLHIYWTNDGNLLQLSKSSAANTGLIFNLSGSNFSIKNMEAGILSFYTNNTERLRILNAYQILSVGDGTAANPAWSFANNTNMGMYRSAANQLSFATSGTERLRINADGTIVLTAYLSGASGAILTTNNTGLLSIRNFTGIANDVLLGTGTFGSLNSLAWQLTGNSGTNPNINFIGTTDAQDLVLRTNNSERMRIKSNGQVVVGSADPFDATDLFTVISTTTSPWAINGYSNQNAGAIYAEISSETVTNYSAIDANYAGNGTGAAIIAYNTTNNTTASAGTAIIGMSYCTKNGTDYYENNYGGVKGYNGLSSSTARCNFGVIGIHYHTGRRSGGVLGTLSTARWGALGYRSNSGGTYGGYFCNNYITGTGKSTPNQFAGIGFASFGDLLGGCIRGDIYGLILKGSRYALYTDGITYANSPIIILNSSTNMNKRTASYVTTSTSFDVISKGVAKVINGTATINLPKEFIELVCDDEPIIITVTPIGRKADIYIQNITKSNFTIIDATQGVDKSLPLIVNWIAIGTHKSYKNIQLADEVLSNDFDNKINNFLIPDSDTTREAIPMWWDGNKLRFDPIPEYLFEKPKSNEDYPLTRKSIIKK